MSLSGIGGGGMSTSVGGSGATKDELAAQKNEELKETFRVVKEMSDILNTGLTSESLGYCLRLTAGGVNPAALAAMIKEWRQNNNEGGGPSQTSGGVNGS